MQGLKPDVGPASSLRETRVQEPSIWKSHNGVQAFAQQKDC